MLTSNLELNSSASHQLCETNFPGEQHNQESIYHSWVSGQMSLQILFALVQPNTKCYSPISGTTHLMDLTNFSLFLLSYLIISDFEP